MIYYGIFFGLEFCFYYLGLLLKSNFSLFSLFLAIIFTGFRYNTGNDYGTYYEIFNSISNYNVNLEPGFYYSVKFFNFLNIHPFAIFFFIAIITYLCVYFIFRDARSSNFQFLLYILTPGLFLNSIHLIRQPLAVSLFCYAFYCLIKKRSFFYFILVSFVSISIHYSAILPVFIAFLVGFKDKPMPKYIYVCLLLFSIVCKFALPIQTTSEYLFNSFDVGYLVYLNWQDGETSLKILIIFLSCIYMIFKIECFQKSRWLLSCFHMYFIGCFIYLYISDISIAARLTYYFTFFFIPLFSFLTDSLTIVKKNIVRSIVLGIYLLLTFNVLFVDQHSNFEESSLSNYKNIFIK